MTSSISLQVDRWATGQATLLSMNSASACCTPLSSRPKSSRMDRTPRHPRRRLQFGCSSTLQTSHP